MFGSRAQGLARIGSDYDFGVLLKNKNVLKLYEQRKNIYNNIYNLLSENINQLVNIDIVFLEDAPAELQVHAVKYGIPIYEINKKVFNNFKEHTMLLYADFESYRKLFQQAILSRI